MASRWRQVVLRLAFICLVGVVLVSCGSATRPHNIRNTPSYYHVRHGDTLYTIAWRFSVDVRDLIGWNRIRPPYTIYPGQKLVMSPPPGYRRPAPVVVAQRPPARKPPVATRPPQRSRQRTRIESGTTVVSPEAQRGGKPAPGQNPVSPPPVATAPVRPPPSPVNSKPAAARTLRWSWPLSGKVVRHFNSTLPGYQGIDIQGRNGQAVKAAESGTVVYSGNALKGYGELIIIQHSADYLSAYANNRERYVREGDKVRRGEKIATLGDRYTNAPRLHFEVRFRGKPVDPLRYLSGAH
ncbi:MAG TPA: LysM peptidoglycan-binding domain-containing protein [Gammaproteobacteria bacterium]|nr:LysM peptidoglycan-binding domain-containing protein [Gammaproteobacteria bacterium]